MTLAELGMAFWHDLAAPVIAGILASMIVNWLNNEKQGVLRSRLIRPLRLEAQDTALSRR